MKRALDLLGALALLILFSWMLGVVAFAVCVSSRGPVIFRQQRLGINGTPFILYKFRTLTDGTGSGKIEDIVKNKDDPRITRMGRVLRSTHLDELPQLWNVLRGEMSLVGPRPVTAEVAEERGRVFPGYAMRFSVRPGLTGLGQLKERAEETPGAVRQRLRLDLFYITHQSLCLDLRVLGRTVPAVMMMRGV